MEEHRPKKLLDQVRDAIRLKHYSYRTGQAYVGWIKRYIVLPAASFRFRLATGTLALAGGSGHRGPQRTYLLVT